MFLSDAPIDAPTTRNGILCILGSPAPNLPN